MWGGEPRPGGQVGHLHLLLGPHPRLEVHTGPARRLPVLQTLRGRGRGGGGGVSMPCAPAPRVSHQVVVGHLGARAAGQEGEETAAREARGFAGRSHLAGVRTAGPREAPEGRPGQRARQGQRAAAGAGTAARGWAHAGAGGGAWRRGGAGSRGGGPGRGRAGGLGAGGGGAGGRGRGGSGGCGSGLAGALAPGCPPRAGRAWSMVILSLFT